MKTKTLILRLLSWIPAVFIFCVSWYLSDQETIEHMPSFWNADKLVHFICFGGLCFWVSFGCRIRKYSSFWIPTCIVSVYGIIDEIHQKFTPGRSSSVFDWMADTLGAMLGAVVFVFVITLICKSIKKSTSDGSPKVDRNECEDDER